MDTGCLRFSISGGTNLQGSKSLPIYLEVKKGILDALINGKYRPGAVFPSSRVLSVEYGCSINTVERAVKELAQEGYLTRREREGTFVCSRDKWGTPTIERASRVIGVIMEDISKGVWSSIVRGIEDCARDASYSIILCNSDNDFQKTYKYIEELEQKGVDGIILSPVGTMHYEEDNAMLIDMMNDLQIPHVLVDRYIESRKVSYVVSDNFGCSYDITQYLIRNGHHKIVFVQQDRVSSVNDRYLGYRKAMEQAGISSEGYRVLIEPHIDFGAIEDSIVKQLRGLRYTAILVQNDCLARWVCNALVRLDKRTPEDVSIAVFDRTNGALGAVEFTSMVQQVHSIGARACKILLDMLVGRDSAIYRIEIPGYFEEGDSVRKIVQDTQSDSGIISESVLRR